MAIFHLSAKTISRAKGQSAVAAAAYRARTTLKDERIGQTFRYAADPELIHSEMMLPAGAPPRLQDRSTFWNEAEAIEDRLIDARYKHRPDYADIVKGKVYPAYEVEISIPIELTQEQGTDLIRRFAQDQFVERGQVVDLNVHWKPGNPHAHLLLSTRSVSDAGFSPRKDKTWRSPTEIRAIRAAWAQAANAALAQAGHSARIDHRSHADAGIELEPTVHVGPEGMARAAVGLSVKEIEHNEEVKRHNAEVIARNPTVIIDELAATQATFTRQDVANRLMVRIKHDHELFPELFAKIEGSAKLVKVGNDITGQARYTSREYLDRERRMLSTIERLAADRRHGVKSQSIESAISAKPRLSDEQKAAIRHLVSDRGIDTLVGRAGTGKTTAVLSTVAEIYKQNGYRVRGAALAGVATDNLAEEAGIEARTLASWSRGWEIIDGLKHDIQATKDKRERARLERTLATMRTKYELGPKDVFMVDEGGMLATKDIGDIVDKVRAAGAKVIFAGDPEQFAAIGAGNAFRGVIDTTGAAYVNTIRRQQVEWQRTASEKFSRLDVGDALDIYRQHGHIHFLENNADTYDSLVDRYFSDRRQHHGQGQIVLAYTNKDVDALNLRIRDHLIREGSIQAGTEFVVEGAKEQKTIQVGQGDRLILLSPDDGSKVETVGGPNGPVRNGTMGTVEAVNGTTISLRVDGTARTLEFDTAKYNSFDHAYAVTEYKAQGKTVDRVYVLASEHMRADAAYVAMTRHRLDVQLYASKEKFEDVVDLARSMGRLPDKDLARDYILSDADKIRFSHVAEYVDTAKEAASIYAEIDAQLAPEMEPWEHDRWDEFSEALNKRNRLAEEIVTNWRSHEVFARQARLTKEGLEIHAGHRERRLTDAEKEAKKQVEGYAEIARKTRDLWNEIKLTHPGASSRQHEDFAKFDELRQLRDEAAFELLQEPTRFRRFAKDAGIRWKAVRTQALRHEQSIASEKAIASLGIEARQAALIAAEYKDARDHAASLWQSIKTEVELAPYKLPIHEAKAYKAWVDAQVSRDRLGYRLATHGQLANTVAGHLRLSPEQIAEAAQRHQGRALVFKYVEAQSSGDDVTRNRLAREATATADVHKRLFREKGITWRDVAEAARRDLEAKVEFTLHPAHRANLARVQEYDGLRREVAMKWDAIVTESLATNSNPVAHSEFNDWVTKRDRRDQLAMEIVEKPDHQFAIKLRKLPIDTLEKHAVAGKQRFSQQQRDTAAQTRVAAYSEAHANGRINERNKLAAEMIAGMRDHLPALRNAGMDWRQIRAHAADHAEAELMKNLTPDDKLRYRRVSRYDTLRRIAGKMWQRISAEIEGDAKPWQHEEYPRWEVVRRERNALAAEIRADLDNHQSAIVHHHVDGQQLSEHAEQHAKTRQQTRTRPAPEVITVDEIIGAERQSRDPVQEYQRAADRAESMLKAGSEPEAIVAAHRAAQARAAAVYADKTAFQAIAERNPELGRRIQADALHHGTKSNTQNIQGGIQQ